MSGSLRLDFAIDGLEELEDAYINAPEAVMREAERAGLEALPVLGNAIAVETPVVTGFLLRNESVSLEGVFNIVFADAAPYARFVNADNPFIERGLVAATPRVDAIYERALDRLATTFAHGA